LDSVKLLDCTDGCEQSWPRVLEDEGYGRFSHEISFRKARIEAWKSDEARDSLRRTSRDCRTHMPNCQPTISGFKTESVSVSEMLQQSAEGLEVALCRLTKTRY